MTFRDIILTIVRLDNQTNKMQTLRLNNYSLKKHMFSENRTNDNQLVKCELHIKLYQRYACDEFQYIILLFSML